MSHTLIRNWLLLLVLWMFQAHANESATPPIVLWHGMGENYIKESHRFVPYDHTFSSCIILGDTCCFPFSLGSVTKMLKSKIDESLYVKSVKIGESIITDYESGFFVHPNKQVRSLKNLTLHRLLP